MYFRDDPSLYIFCQAVDDAPDFSLYGPLGRDKTKAFVRWDEEDIGQGWRSSPDLALIIQEIVSRQGWKPGNALVFLWQNAAGRLRFRQWDHGEGANAARLNVTFETADH